MMSNPIAPQNAPAPRDAGDPALADNAAVAAGRVRLLLVEDDTAVRRSLQLLLRGRGYDVRAYAGGHQILADPTAPDAACLITDYRLDGLNGLTGIDVLRHLRARGWQRPAILVTAFDGARLRAAARTAGFDSVLEKPLQDHMFMATLGRMIRRR